MKKTTLPQPRLDFERRGKMNERHKHTDKGGDYELTEDVELLVAPGLVIANFL